MGAKTDSVIKTTFGVQMLWSLAADITYGDYLHGNARVDINAMPRFYPAICQLGPEGPLMQTPLLAFFAQ